MVAERVHKQKRVGVVVKSLFWGAKLDPMTSGNIHAAIHRLRSVLDMTQSETLWIPFDVLVQQFDGTHEFLDDDKLDSEQLMVMSVLRGMNNEFASIFGGRNTEQRRLIPASLTLQMAGPMGQRTSRLLQKSCPRFAKERLHASCH